MTYLTYLLGSWNRVTHAKTVRQFCQEGIGITNHSKSVIERRLWNMYHRMPSNRNLEHEAAAVYCPECGGYHLI